jgi:hypothetical protein
MRLEHEKNLLAIQMSKAEEEEARRAEVQEGHLARLNEVLAKWEKEREEVGRLKHVMKGQESSYK